MTDTCQPPVTAEWRPISDLLVELTGSTCTPRTASTWAAAGLPTLRGRRGQLLTRRVDLLAFLRQRGPRLQVAE